MAKKKKVEMTDVKETGVKILEEHFFKKDPGPVDPPAEEPGPIENLDPAIRAEMEQGEGLFPGSTEPEQYKQEDPEGPRSEIDTVTESQTLKCYLTPVEIRDTGERMARAVGEMNETAATLKSVSTELKARIASTEGTISECATKIRSGYEFRPVEVSVYFDYATGTVRKVRNDTFEEIEERPMTAHERQRSIKFRE